MLRPFHAVWVRAHAASKTRLDRWLVAFGVAVVQRRLRSCYQVSTRKRICDELRAMHPLLQYALAHAAEREKPPVLHGCWFGLGSFLTYDFSQGPKHTPPAKRRREKIWAK